MLKRGGTKLSVIDKHELYVMCNCGHAESVRVSDIIKVLGGAATVGFAVDKLRCSKCRMKKVREYRITYEPGPDGH